MHLRHLRAHALPRTSRHSTGQARVVRAFCSSSSDQVPKTLRKPKRLSINVKGDVHISISGPVHLHLAPSPEGLQDLLKTLTQAAPPAAPPAAPTSMPTAAEHPDAAAPPPSHHQQPPQATAAAAAAPTPDCPSPLPTVRLVTEENARPGMRVRFRGTGSDGAPRKTGGLSDAVVAELLGRTGTLLGPSTFHKGWWRVDWDVEAPRNGYCIGIAPGADLEVVGE